MSDPQPTLVIGALLGLYFKADLPKQFNGNVVSLGENDRIQFYTSKFNWDIWVTDKTQEAMWGARNGHDIVQILARIPGRPELWEWSYVPLEMLNEAVSGYMANPEDALELLQNQYVFESLSEFQSACQKEIQRQYGYEIWNIRNAFYFDNQLPGWSFIRLLKHWEMWDKLPAEAQEEVHLITQINNRGKYEMWVPEQACFKTVTSGPISQLAELLHSLCLRHSISCAPEAVDPRGRHNSQS